MRSRVRENAATCCGAAVAVAIVGWLALSSWMWTDYDTEARPAFDALLGGHFGQFLTLAPAYGGSLLMRAPFVFIPKLWGGGELSTFRAAAAPCLVASAVLAVWIVARMRARGQGRLARTVALLLLVANPLTIPALEYGHPEEILGAVLCIASVLVATRGRPIWAGALLGLAIANKDWAVVAVGPVLVATPHGRVKALVTAGGIAAAALAPFALAGSAGSVVHGSASQTGTMFNPWQLWWFLGTHSHPVLDLAGHVKLGYRVPPAWISGIAHPLIVLITVPLTLLFAWVRRTGRRGSPGDALLLLSLVLFLRFALDPWNISYYSLPFLLALLVWEVLTRDRPPVLALAASFLAWLTLQETAARGVSADMQSLIFLAVAVPAVIALATALYAPGISTRLAIRVRRRAPMPSPA
jgi:hypothetical protein